MANVRVTLEDGMPVIKFEVELFGLPNTPDRGHEVTVNFFAKKEDLDNDNIFYTDTNGLEMIERRINYRPTWDLDLGDPN